MENAIKLAHAGGWKAEQNAWVTELGGSVNVIHRADILLDPLFWQALGESLGWSNCLGFIQTGDTGEIENWLEGDSTGTVFYWQYIIHRFIDHLAEGKNADSFFQELVK